MGALKRLAAALLAAVLLSACVVSAEGGGFSDVREGQWFYDNVTAMVREGYLSGYPDGSFKPDNIITAAEFVTVAARVGGLQGSAAQSGHWAAPLLQAALDKGWYDWDEIPPTAGTYDEPVTRQLAVKILMKAFAPGLRGDYNTESAKIRDFSLLDGRYYEPVLAAYSAGIVNGDDQGNFNPKGSLKRSEACALITRAMDKLGAGSGGTAPTPSPVPTPTPPPVTTKRGVSENGHLQVIGTQLCNEDGEAVVLRGMSSHGIQWFPQFLSGDVIKSTADRGANLFRVAMYTAEGGYISDKDGMKQRLINAVDAAAALDMYTIIDWHILSDGNPNTYKAEAKAFFEEMAQRYKGNPAVLYEICNEPNGNVTWSGDVKPYAEEIIKTIRGIDEKAVILVGSPTWSQDLHEAAKDPLKGENIMYTCHFYAGTHRAWLRDRIAAAVRQGLPVFVSEWGTSDASGGGGVYLDEARRWMDFMNENKISWANWSLCDKNESSAALAPGADVSGGIGDEDLSESGKFVFSHFEG